MSLVPIDRENCRVIGQISGKRHHRSWLRLPSTHTDVLLDNLSRISEIYFVSVDKNKKNPISALGRYLGMSSFSMCV